MAKLRNSSKGDLNLGSFGYESGILLLNYCAPLTVYMLVVSIWHSTAKLLCSTDCVRASSVNLAFYC